MSDVSDDENDFTEEQTEYTEGGEENDEIKKKKEKVMSAYATRKTVGEENEDEEESESEEENEGEENEDEDGSEGGEENEENDSTNEDAEDGEVAVSSGDIDIEIDGNTKEVVKKLTMKEKFNDMERKKILIISLIFSLIVSLPSGLGIGLGTAPVPSVPDYCSYPKFKPCRENGKCVMVNGLPTCECNKEWEGELCNMPSCDNDAACVTENSNRDKCTFQPDRGVKCHCKEGFTGQRCEDETDLCQKGEFNGCNNHGTCSMVDGMPECKCEAGWTGLTCAGPSCTTSSNEDYCDQQNTANCDDSDGYAKCECKSGYYGVKCEFSAASQGFGR